MLKQQQVLQVEYVETTIRKKGDKNLRTVKILAMYSWVYGRTELFFSPTPVCS